MNGNTGKEEFARLVEAIEPYLPDVVIIGGWAHQLYHLHPDAQPVSYVAVTTLDTDVAVPRSLRAEGRDLRERLMAAGFAEERLAEHALDRLLFRINDPGYRPSRVATVAEFAERWKDQVLSKRKPSTKKAAESHLGVYILPRLGKLRLENLGVESQQMFVGYLSERVSRKTVLNVVGTLSSMLNTAKNWGYICEGVSVSRLVLPQREVKQQARTFTRSRQKRFSAWRTIPGASCSRSLPMPAYERARYSDFLSRISTWRAVC